MLCYVMVCMYVCMFVCMYVCMYIMFRNVYIDIYIYIFVEREGGRESEADLWRSQDKIMISAESL